MKSCDAVIRLKRFEVEETGRKVTEIETMIGEFNTMAADLDHQIAVEQERVGITDVNHYAYPTFAKAAKARRDNLAASVGGLEAKLAAARSDLELALEEMKKVELLHGRDSGHEPAKDVGGTPDPLSLEEGADRLGMIGVQRVVG